MKYKILIISLIVAQLAFAQRLLKITVHLENEQKELSYIVRNGIDYVSVSELADLLNASKYYNQEAEKIELKFPDYNVKITAKNQFVIIQNKKENSQSVFQLPISALLLRNDIYIPLNYSLEYFTLASSNTFNYDPLSKNLIVKTTNSNTAAALQTSDVKNDSIKKFSLTSNYDINDVSIEEKANGTLVKLQCAKIIRAPRSSISNGILYLFLSNVSVAKEIESKAIAVGLVKSIKVTKIDSKNAQLEISLAEGYSSVESFQDSQSKDLIITIHNKLFANIDDSRSKWNFDCIVIDAGHGGKDPGTIGVTGTKEKDINLAVALKLGKLIESNLTGIKVIYTRRTDQFIELYKRGKIANEAGGKLFISIHCNSTEKKDNGVRGFEVYLLRPGRTQEAIRIAEFENSVIKYEEDTKRYDKLTDENFILVSMAHSQFMRYSENFSDILNQIWKSSVSIPSLGIKQAGFYVLVGASMPNVLIETGFLSNRKEESFLASSKGQNEVAQTIFESVKKYKEFYEKEIQN